jgi:hypothetical protein
MLPNRSGTESRASHVKTTLYAIVNVNVVFGTDHYTMRYAMRRVYYSFDIQIYNNISSAFPSNDAFEGMKDLASRR